jgi:glycosyltransferase involved in cell wall biosynthesis
MNRNIRLSIILLTYNHENYIRQSLESILMQRVNFEYEVIVLEDCSTDNTRKIVLEYKNKFKNIMLFFNKRNYGGSFTHIIGKRYANKEYVALLEGDDYWVNIDKLQQQIDFLDNNQYFIGCAHNTELLYEKNDERKLLIKSDNRIKTVCDIKDLILGGCYFHTSSYVWRNIFKDGYPKEHYYSSHGIYMGDWFLSMLYARHGNIKYIDKVMSCYRISGKGAWTQLPEHVQHIKNIRGMYIYNKLLNYQYSEEFKRIWRYCEDVVKMLPKDYKTYPSIIELYCLKRSIDVNANKKLLLLFDEIKNTLDRKLSHKLTQLRVYRFFIKLVLFLAKRMDKMTMRFFEFLFNCFHFFGIGGYNLYYKAKFYQLFKINMYVDKEIPKR